VLSNRQRDLVSGALCIAAGIGVLIEARKDTIGSLDRLGPGFYPALLGTLLTLVGLMIAATALTTGTRDEDTIHDAPTTPDWRGCACIVGGVIAFVVFAWLTGLVLAIFACVFIGALGDRTATLRGSLLLASGMAVSGTVLFGYLLGINMPLWHSLWAP
jgi:putative Ca2+/H+ antiporter (TMEM165/GDT1 family)